MGYIPKFIHDFDSLMSLIDLGIGSGFEEALSLDFKSSQIEQLF